MSCEIVWRSSVPKEIKAEVSKLLAKYRFMIPAWLNSLSVHYYLNQDDPDENLIATSVALMKVEWEYRQARLTIMPKWMECKDHFKDLTIAHELTHILLGPMDAWAKSLIDNAVKDEGMQAFLVEDWRKLNEGATEDVSNIIAKLKR